MARRAPALGTFLTQLRQRLAGLPPEELRGVLLTHAERLPADARADFLSIFPDPEHRTVSRPVGQWIDLVDLDDRVRDLAVRVASGEFGDPDGGDDWDYGYDWGGPEWGAEEARVPDWVAEASGLVDDASQLFLSGDPEQGRAAFGLVLAMFGITTESDPPADIALEIAYLEPATVDEMLARYLRCVYETSAPADRATALRHAWSSLPWRIEPLRLTDVIEARAQPLPDLAGFLPDWIDLLVSDETWPPQRDGVRLLAEAARLHPGPDPMAGLDTLADLAQRPGRHRGGINLVRVDALAAAGRTRDAAEAAVTALSLPDLTPELRAAIADRLADIAIDLGDLDDAIAARVTAWRAQPSRVRLLALVADARTAGVPDTTLAAEAKRISAAARRPGAGLPDRLSCELLLLAGRDGLAVKALIAAAPLGWSNSAHPGPVVLPYLWAASGEIPARGQLRSLFE